MAIATKEKTVPKPAKAKAPLPVRRNKAEAKPEPAAEWVLWGEDSTTVQAYTNLKKGYADVHGRDSDHYKALLRRTPWWAQSGNRWYLAIEVDNGKVWFFNQAGKLAVTTDSWPTKYDYFNEG